MSRGIGRAQRAILDRLQTARIGVTELAEQLGLSDRQVRRAVHALERRGAVQLTTEAAKLPDGRWAPKKLFVQSKPAEKFLRQSTFYLQDDGTVGTTRTTLNQLLADSAPPTGRRATTDESRSTL